MENDKKKQIIYQKTEFNYHKICQLPGIFKCSKCKRNNATIVGPPIISQACLFCGSPNYVKREAK